MERPLGRVINAHIGEVFDESVADPLTPLQRAMTPLREQEDAPQLER